MRKILVTEDSRGWLAYHSDMLKQILGANVQIDLAPSARKGYDFIYQNLSQPYDLIITDLQMECDFEPKMAGEWFIEQVRMMKEYSNTPIIIISACYNIRTIAENLKVSYLPKATAAKDLVAYKLAITELLK